MIRHAVRLEWGNGKLDGRAETPQPIDPLAKDDPANEQNVKTRSGCLHRRPCCWLRGLGYRLPKHQSDPQTNKTNVEMR